MMTEEQIERKVERMVDALDKSFMNGELTQEQYATEMRGVDHWAAVQYKAIEQYERLAGRID